MKKLLSILLIIMIIITFIQIRNVYALYKDQISGGYSVNLSDWEIVVNGTNITHVDGDVIEFEMTGANIGYDDGFAAATGVSAVAPDTDAFFELLIEPKSTDAAFKYEIEIGEVSKYKVYETATGNVIPDEDGNEEREIVFPFTFSVNELEADEMAKVDTFGTYTYNLDEFDAIPDGTIVGSDSAENASIARKNKVDTEKNCMIGVFSLEAIESGLEDKVKIFFRWSVEDVELTDSEKEALKTELGKAPGEELTEAEILDKIAEKELQYKEMYNHILEQNNATQSVKLVVPIKFSAIQYLGEEL